MNRPPKCPLSHRLKFLPNQPLKFRPKCPRNLLPQRHPSKRLLPKSPPNRLRLNRPQKHQWKSPLNLPRPQKFRPKHLLNSDAVYSSTAARC